MAHKANLGCSVAPIAPFHAAHQPRTGLRLACESFILALGLVGVEQRALKRTVIGLPKYIADAASYARHSASSEPFAIGWRNLHPVFGEHRGVAGGVGGHYFHQDLWAARKIFERSPQEHLDVGSRVDGFVAHVLTFMPVTLIDVRPLPEHVEGLRFVQGDATNLSGIPDASLDSISSLHAVEHFGLGRYGDKVDPSAASKAMTALARVLAPGGRLYFSVPIGRERLMFNAHRIFSPATVLGAFAGLNLLSFAAVDDAGNFCTEVTPEDFLGAGYSCGLFEYGKA